MELKNSIVWLLAIGVLAVCVFAREHQENEFGSDLESLSIADDVVSQEIYERAKRGAYNPSRAQNDRTWAAKQSISNRLAQETANRAQQSHPTARDQLAAIENEQRNNLHSITNRLMAQAQQRQRDLAQRGQSSQATQNRPSTSQRRY